MNKNMYKTLFFSLVFWFIPFIKSMEQQKIPLWKVYAIAKEPQKKLNKFWSGLYDFEQERINSMIATQKKSITAKTRTISLNSNEILNKKIKKGILYSLPTIATALVSAYGFYYAHKSLHDDSSGLKDLVYSSAIAFTGGYCCLNYTVPYFKTGIYSLYKCLDYKNYLKTKLEKNLEASEKIEMVSND